LTANQKTIKSAVSFSGVGLHTGGKTTVTFKPAPPDTGVVFVRTDLPGRPGIQADVAHVVDVSRGTTIGIDGIKILTIEHVLAAIAGLEIDNVIAEVDADEAPVGDGSASPFVEALSKAGLEEQGRPRKEINITRPVAYDRNGISLLALPSDRLKLSYTIEYNHPALDSQFCSFEIDPLIFAREIAPARTYCFLHDVERLKKAGLIKGGSLENAIVIGDEGVLNDNLRFTDEFARHKVLDLLGDLALLGENLVAHVVAIKGGHASHIEFMKQIRSEIGRDDDRDEPETGAREADGIEVFDAVRISEILPHRHPFVFVDRITKLDRKHAEGIKNVTISEPFFQGHMPGRPIMPGVLIIEAIAQVGAVLFLSDETHTGKLPYLFGIEKAKFRKPVYPGDRMDIAVEILNLHKRYGKLRGQVSVDGKLAAEAEIVFGTP
jgi:UDP-3-O-[3-hydroxymyristoyl] N-acetylglucosamine deacetylase/3-hydroxyacyl-[acyl-carrier-protein] dehydratase